MLRSLTVRIALGVVLDRPGNRPSREGVEKSFGRAIAGVHKAGFRRVRLRGDWLDHSTRGLGLLTILTALALVGGVSSAEGADAPAAKPAKPLNVLMIVSDDQGWTDLGFMGHPVIKTPHLDKLAGQSATFVNGYVPTSLCRASLATILTGLYAHQHNICCNDPPKGVDRERMLPFLGTAPTVPRLLSEKLGYRCLQTGKWWEGHFTNGGFTHGMTEKGRHGDEGLLIGRKTNQPVFDFIEAAERDAKPWMVWYAPMMPHTPHNPPAQYLAKYTAPDRPGHLAKYFAMCEWFDAACGEVLGYLDRKGLAENTLVVFVVDNGWIQTGGPVSVGDVYVTRGKNTPYDGGVRTPILFRLPGKTQTGRYEDLVCTIDLAPTILAACGLPPTQSMEGLNLLPRVAGGAPVARDTVYGEIFLHNGVELGRPALSVTHRWLRQGDWKLIVQHRPEPKVELFALRADPTEQKDLASAEPERVKQLQALLDAWWPGK